MFLIFSVHNEMDLPTHGKILRSLGKATKGGSWMPL